MMSRLLRSNFLYKLRHWEFWPFGVLQAPFFVYWLWLSAKARSLFFFSASNPTILTGGMLGESKFEVLQLVPESSKPKTLLVKLPASMASLQKQIHEAQLSFPLIFKPDLGERGWMVRKISSAEEAAQYLNEIKIDFLIQEFLPFEHEFGVFYVRKPSQQNGSVVSITGKAMLAVTGDGNRTLAQLVADYPRARFQEGVLQKRFEGKWNSIIPSGERIVLNAIGNHCLGTTFLNHNHLITPTLTASFDALAKKIPGFYFGRFDLRCESLAHLEMGAVKIMELNGCGAEPAHIYQPGFSLWQALKVLYIHWKSLYEISAENHKLGVPYLSFAEGRAIFKKARTIIGKS